MLRYALRRVLWSIPTLLATSLFLFLVVTTLAPPPIALGEAAPAAESARIEEARRSQFFDLPRFFNADPADVRTGARDALALLATDDPRQQEEGARTLARQGGAALP